MIVDDDLANYMYIVNNRTIIADDGLANTCILYTTGE